MATLTANTLVRHPETGEVVLLAAGGTVPEWAGWLVGEHLLDGQSGGLDMASAKADTGANSVDPDDAKPAGDDGPPPKGGVGSDAEAWRAYAASRGVEVPADAKRPAIIAALEAAGVPTE